MLTRSLKRLFLFGALLLATQQGAYALLNIDGTRNQVFVFGTIAIAFDSNIFSSAANESDYIYAATVGAKIKRHAGIISVNASATFDRQQFSKNSALSAWNPNFNLEFNKTIGRTTGAFTVSAFRSSRADSAVNLRTQTWNFPLGLNVKYPINDNLYLTSASSYLNRRYTNGSGLMNYADWGESIDMFYVWTSKTDIVLGYRYRVGHTTVDTSVDQSLSFGLVNEIIPKLNGQLRAGYQRRTNKSEPGKHYDQITIATQLQWVATRKFSMQASVSRDFSTSAIGGTVDSLSGQLRALYDFNRRHHLNGGVAYGRNRFLGTISGGRRDDFFSWDVGYKLHWNEHLEIGLSYNYLHNWSTLSFSDFEKYGYSLDLTSNF